MLWPVLAAMTLAALALLLLPLLRRQREAVGREAYDVAIYRDQFDEIGRDLDRGLITEEEAQAARLEIERRLLSVAKDSDGPAAGGKPLASSRSAVVAAGVIAIILPLAAGLGYVYLGSPGLSGQSFAERAPARSPPHADMAVLAARLANRLERSPGDLQGWLLLASTYIQLQRFDDAAKAYARAIPLASDSPGTLSDITAAYGEVLIFASGGVVTPLARAAFMEALVKDGTNARATYYLGLALLQKGKAREALSMWVAMAAKAPADAPWLTELRQRISRIAKEQDIDLSKLGPPADPAGGTRDISRLSPPADPAVRTGPVDAPPRGPGQAEIEAAARMSANERRAMIETMVAGLASRLESRPDDFNGWQRLGRSYTVLGRHDDARDAYARAAKLRPKDVSVLLLHAGALLEAAGRPKRLPADFISIMRRVVALDPDNQEALWYLGRAAIEAGDGGEAVTLWRRLLAVLPPGNARRAMVERAIESLNKK